MDRCFNSLRSRGDRVQYSSLLRFIAWIIRAVFVHYQDLLCYGCESQVHVEASLCAGFHER